MLTSGINLTSFKKKIKILKVKQNLTTLIKEKNHVISSLSKNYKNSYSKKQLDKYKKSSNFRLIGMGGSTLGAKSIFNFLEHKIKKKFYFIDNLHGKTKYIDKKKMRKFNYFKVWKYSGNYIKL